MKTKEKILKEFDEKYVGDKIVKIYSWKAEAYTDCSGVRDFLKYIITQTREETIREVEELLENSKSKNPAYHCYSDVNRMVENLLNKLKK